MGSTSGTNCDGVSCVTLFRHSTFDHSIVRHRSSFMDVYVVHRTPYSVPQLGLSDGACSVGEKLPGVVASPSRVFIFTHGGVRA